MFTAFLHISLYTLSYIRREEIKSLCMTYMSNSWSTVRFLTFAENEALLNFIVDTAVRAVLTLI